MLCFSQIRCYKFEKDNASTSYVYLLEIYVDNISKENVYISSSRDIYICHMGT